MWQTKAWWMGSLTLLLLGAGGCSKPTALYGTVVDLNGEPVMGAEVRVSSHSASKQTESDGRFRLGLGYHDGTLEVEVDGSPAVGGPYSSARTVVGEDAWILSPGGKPRNDVMDDGEVRVEVGLILKRLEIETAVSLRPSEGGVVTSLTYPNARLAVPAVEQPEDDEMYGVALTEIPVWLLPLQPPSLVAPLVAVHIHSETQTLASATLELPVLRSTGDAGAIQLYRLDLEEGWQAVGPAALDSLESGERILNASGDLQDGYYCFGAAR